ncbi:MAG TPA: hypothetical protein VKR22_13350 [Acidimicrobiales bacterium]|nr:hypothetical protein [Acidimicrobiales bacterium]
MSMFRRALSAAVVVAGTVALSAGLAGALENPTTGHPGAPNLTCGSAGATVTPGHAVNAQGSPFNSGGVAGMHYAGNTGTSSLANSNSTAAVSQYDVACRNNTAH